MASAVDEVQDAVAIGALTDAQRIKAIFAASAGNLVEWYDFYIYALAAFYFSAAFFPDSDTLVQLLATSGIFAAGFFTRPIGGWFFGRYADRYGRRESMVFAIMLMGGGSLLIACLPTYEQVGVLAPVLLLIGRLIQGFSTGGEYGTAATYMSEIAGRGRRGFWSSFQYVTLIAGQLCAAAIILLLQLTLSEQAMYSYGWRIAFLIGAVGAVAVLFIRRGMHETTTAEDRHETAGSLKHLLQRNSRAFVTVMVLTAAGSLMFYTFTTYMQKYLVLTAGLAKETATAIMTGVLVVFMLLQPLMGLLSDRIGRRNNLIVFAGLGLLLTVPLLTALAEARTPATAFMLVLAGLIVISFYSSVSGIFKAEMFPVHVRALGVGLSYGIANALFGGTAETVALVFKQAGNESHFYWYVTGMCALALVAALTLKDTRRENVLDDLRV